MKDAVDILDNLLDPINDMSFEEISTQVRTYAYTYVYNYSIAGNFEGFNFQKFRKQSSIFENINFFKITNVIMHVHFWNVSWQGKMALLNI